MAITDFMQCSTNAANRPLAMDTTGSPGTCSTVRLAIFRFNAMQTIQLDSIHSFNYLGVIKHPAYTDDLIESKPNIHHDNHDIVPHTALFFYWTVVKLSCLLCSFDRVNKTSKHATHAGQTQHSFFYQTVVKPSLTMYSVIELSTPFAVFKLAGDNYM